MQRLPLVNQGIYYKRIAEYEHALARYQEALKICELLSPKAKARVLTLVNLGNLYSDINEHSKVIATMSETIRLANLHENPEPIKIGAYNAIANSYSSLNEHDKALDYYLRAKVLAERINRLDYLGIILNNIGDLYLLEKSYEKAREYILIALDVNKKIQNAKAEASSYMILGAIEVELNRPDSALAFLTKGKKLAEENGYKKDEMEFYNHMAQAYALQKKYGASYAAQKSYAQLRDNLFKEITQATKLDLNEEASRRITRIKRKNKVISWFGISMTLLSICISVILIKKRNYARAEAEQLKVEHKLLFNKLSAMKNKMQSLAADTISKNALQESQAPKRYENSSLTLKDREQHMNKILDIMETEKPYLDLDMNQVRLAEMLSLSSHHLSEILHYCFRKNFYGFLNLYRVEEAKKLLSDPANQDKKIMALAYDSGFKSKTSFNRIFKNHLGLTPSEYRKAKMAGKET